MRPRYPAQNSLRLIEQNWSDQAIDPVQKLHAAVNHVMPARGDAQSPAMPLENGLAHRVLESLQPVTGPRQRQMATACSFR